MIFGFIAGAIVMERTVATKTWWAWAAPAFHTLGVVLLISGAPRQLTAVTFWLSFATIRACYVLIYQLISTMKGVIKDAGNIIIISCGGMLVCCGTVDTPVTVRVVSYK